MRKILLNVDELAVESFPTDDFGPAPALDRAAGTAFCTRYDTCTNCPQETCIC